MAHHRGRVRVHCRFDEMVHTGWHNFFLDAFDEKKEEEELQGNEERGRRKIRTSKKKRRRHGNNITQTHTQTDKKLTRCITDKYKQRRSNQADNSAPRSSSIQFLIKMNWNERQEEEDDGISLSLLLAPQQQQQSVERSLSCRQNHKYGNCC